MNPLEALGVSLLVGAAVGGVVYAVWKFAESRLPGYTAVDAKTRKVEKYLERQKQGLK